MNPAPASAGFFSFVTSLFSGPGLVLNSSPASTSNSQTLPLLQTATNYDLTASRGGGDITVVDDEALMSENGPSGTLADISNSTDTGQISKYTVRKGDTLSGIAKMFGVSSNTIVWANDLSSKILREGQILVILPVSGIIHTIAKGDTIKSIAKKYNGDPTEIVQYNGIDSDGSLAVGDQIIIPDGESSVPVLSAIPTRGVTARPHDTNGPNYVGYYDKPLSGGIITQGLHGYNAVDFGTPVGTTVLASAPGEVIIAKTSGWNSGYGNYIVISHDNGTQTLYAHLSAVIVYEGEKVMQSQVIGLSGGRPGDQGAGKSTGPHLHFEVRGAKNPFGVYSVGKNLASI
jgi:murein DD-endopeptidase MepM/ murein hydrolase activator NlpD